MSAGASPLLDEIWARMAGRAADEAAELFCAEHGCHRRPSTTDWKFFLTLPPRARVLEVGAGFGDDTLPLCSRASHVVALVPSRANGRIVERRLAEAGITNGEVVAVEAAARLPLGDATIDVVAIEDVAAAGFGLTGETLTAAIAEFDRVLAADGTIFFGVRNGYRSWPALRSLAPESLNRTLKLAAATGRRGASRGEVVRAMRRRGFPEPQVYAPLPHEQAIEAVVPLDHPAPLRYCLGRFLRQNSLVTRAVGAAASAAATAGLLPALLPYYFLFFHRRAAAG